MADAYFVPAQKTVDVVSTVSTASKYSLTPTSTVHEKQDHVDISPQDTFEVHFDPNDTSNPHNWSRLYRWYVTAFAGLMMLSA